MKSINFNTILLIGVAVLLTLQLRSCFDKVHKPESMIRNEERIKYLEEKRLSDSVVLVQTRSMYDSLISASKQKTVVLAGQFQQTKKIYDKIPVIINDLDREQLRRSVADY